MELQSKRLQALRDDLLITFHEENHLEQGQNIKVECSDTTVVAEQNSQDIRGCGETLCLMKVPADIDGTFELLADMFVMHLHNDHGFDSPI